MPLPPPNTLQIFTQAVHFFQTGQLREAERLCRQIPVGDSRHADSRHLLGLIFFRGGQPAPAADFIRQAIGLDGRNAAYHANLAMVLLALGRAEDSVAACRQAIQLKPDFPEAHRGLGDALYGLGRLDEAQASYRAALARQPDDVNTLVNLGGILSVQGAADQAIVHYRRAIALQPGHATAHFNLANALWGQGKLDEAIAAYRQTVKLKPDHVQAHNNLSAALHQQGRPDEAEAVYRHKLAADPDNVAALNDLALLLAARGDSGAALGFIKHALKVAETPEIKRNFTTIVRPLRWFGDDPALRALLVRALMEPWVRPSDLAWTVASLLKCNPMIAAAIAASDQERLSLRDVENIAGDTLLLALLENAPNVDPGLEKLLTAARRLLLEAEAIEDSAVLRFQAALARQCFVNEYVFIQTEAEISRVAHLRDAMLMVRREGKAVPASWLLAVASYIPLHAIAGSETLLDAAWPDAIAAVLNQQIREPLAEMRLSATIPRLTPIDDAVSRRVQAQYEENPYPRWVKLSPLSSEPGAPFLPRRIPQAVLPRAILAGTQDHLVAGCGTGQQSIEAALREPGSRILAIDLSVASLAYAMRKSHELGIQNLEHAQADILDVAMLERDFDLIECFGVLHHLADPFAGWTALLSRLRPGGIMMVGLYSDLGRRMVAQARADIAARGYGTRPDDIRRYRQDILRGDVGDGSPARSGDFYSLSTCRDMLFHVQEHRLSLPQIAAFLHDRDLEFLGFLLDQSVLSAYRRRFPGDAAGTDLAQWDVFEQENPDTFTIMYNFCIQKK